MVSLFSISGVGMCGGHSASSFRFAKGLMGQGGVPKSWNDPSHLIKWKESQR